MANRLGGAGVTGRTLLKVEGSIAFSYLDIVDARIPGMFDDWRDAGKNREQEMIVGLPALDRFVGVLTKLTFRRGGNTFLPKKVFVYYPCSVKLKVKHQGNHLRKAFRVVRHHDWRIILIY